MAKKRRQSGSYTIKPKMGFPVVVTAPSGSGKTSICRAVARGTRNVVYSVSLSTRVPRKGEKSGKDYVFVTEKRFKDLAASGALAEWAVIYGSYYGTPRKRLEDSLARGCCVLLDLDRNGGEAIRRKYPGTVLVYILPPSMKELERRLRGRKTDSASTIRERLKAARKETTFASQYDYVVTNRSLSRTVDVLKSIISAERHRRERLGRIVIERG